MNLQAFLLAAAKVANSSHFDKKWIVLIVVLGVWLIFLFVFGLLSWKYQKKHDAYKKVRDAYEEKFAEAEKNADIAKLLLPIKTNIKLPEGESFYDIEHKVSCFITQKKKSKSKKKSKRRMKRRELLEDYNDFYGVVSLKDIYGLKKSKKKFKYPDILGDLYVTNKRILIKEKKDFEEIKMEDVKSCNQTVVYVEGEFIPGFSIATDEDIYQFLNDDPTVIIIIRELMKRLKGIEEK